VAVTDAHMLLLDVRWGWYCHAHSAALVVWLCTLYVYVYVFGPWRLPLCNVSRDLLPHAANRAVLSLCCCLRINCSRLLHSHTRLCRPKQGHLNKHRLALWKQAHIVHTYHQTNTKLLLRQSRQ
jgi:hypothetical protein